MAMEFFNEYGFLFAASALLLLIIFIITAISLGSKIKKLKRQNTILSKQANEASRFMEEQKSAPSLNTAQMESYSAIPETAENGETVTARHFDAALTLDKNDGTLAAAQTKTSASQTKVSPVTSLSAETKKPAKKERDDEKDEVVVDEATKVKYTVKYDRLKQNWIILKEGNERPTRRVDTKAEAMSIAKELSKKYDASLSVHKKDGKFQKQ